MLGVETICLADTAKGPDEVQNKIAGAILRDGSITVVFGHKGKETVMYGHCQHTKQETK